MDNQQILTINRHPKLTTSLPYLKKTVKTIFGLLKLSGSGVEITLVDDVFMRRQNQKHMGKRGTTDVLSFPQTSVPLKKAGDPAIFKGVFLGDILISLDQAQKQALLLKHSLRKEVLFLILHSILHLVGYDHHTEKERVRMQGVESRIWKKLLREM